MNLLINQPFGIGDCIFCQTLASRWMAEGHTVTWPVFTQFVTQLQRAYPRVKWVDAKDIAIDYNRQDEYDTMGYRVAPLRFNVELMKVPYSDCMRSKYSMFDLDFNIWREGAMWVRDRAREDELYRIIAGQKWPYRLINDTYGSDMSARVDMPAFGSSGLLSVRMNAIKDYSLFDWAKVIENATEIHTVSTSIIYLLEMLDLKAKEVHLYNRPISGQGFDNIDYILTKHKYIFHV